MATLILNQTHAAETPRKGQFGAAARLALFALSPLAALGGVNLAGESLSITPLFFSPLGIPGWLGAGIHMALVLSVGLSMGLVANSGRPGVVALRWGFALVAAMIAFPFIAAPLDSMALALLMTSVLLLALATAIRMVRISRPAGWLMLPVLTWIGFGAALGLAVAAAWSPPFALINAQQPAFPAN
jgi:tryptophan-rich sensory protein